MSKLPEFSSMRELRLGRDPYLDAWLLHFMTENNIEPSVNPAENAQPEQLRFMVDLDNDHQPYITLDFTHPSKPAVLTGVSEIGGEADPSFRYLIMPIRFGA